MFLYKLPGVSTAVECVALFVLLRSTAHLPPRRRDARESQAGKGAGGAVGPPHPGPTPQHRCAGRAGAHHSPLRPSVVHCKHHHLSVFVSAGGRAHPSGAAGKAAAAARAPTHLRGRRRRGGARRAPPAPWRPWVPLARSHSAGRVAGLCAPPTGAVQHARAQGRRQGRREGAPPHQEVGGDIQGCQSQWARSPGVCGRCVDRGWARSSGGWGGRALCASARGHSPPRVLPCPRRAQRHDPALIRQQRSAYICPWLAGRRAVVICERHAAPPKRKRRSPVSSQHGPSHTPPTLSWPTRWGLPGVRGR